MPDLVVGSPPRGADYFGRDDLITTLWKRLEKDNVLLAAPRRFGKTGAMYRLLDEPREPFRPVFMDVEDIESASDFMVVLLANLLKDRHFKRVLGKLWKGTRGLGAFIRGLPESIDLGGIKIKLRQETEIDRHWSDYGEKVMQLLATDGPPLLLLIDEFAIMVQSIGERDRSELVRFLRWFRAARIAPETQIRFVLGSSINLVHTLDGLGLVGTVNDLWTQRLGPFSPETAKSFVAQVFAEREVALGPEVRATILHLIGAPIPYLLSVFLASIFERRRRAGGEVTPEMVRTSFAEDLLEGSMATTFHHYRSRLDEYYSRDEALAARAVLTALSRSDRALGHGTLQSLYLQATGAAPGFEADESFARLLGKLENDFYVRGENGRFSFFSRVLQLWWRTRFGFQEVPSP